MMTSRWTTIAIGAALLTSACTKTANVLESTTTTLRLNEVVTATSADGLLSVSARITGPLERADLTIATRRDVQVSGQLGLAYEVSVSRAVELAGSAALRIEVPASSDAALAVLAVVASDGEAVELAAERSGRRLTHRLAKLERILFALVTTQCGLSACGAPCGPSVPTSTASCEAPVAASHVCSDHGACLPAEQVACVPMAGPEGWDDAPGTGRTFVVNHVAIAGPDVVSDAVDPCLWTSPRNQLAPLALANDQLRQGLLGGEALLLFELTGLDAPYTGTDGSLTVRTYAGRDADDPFFPANNFRVPDGESTCCEFMLDPQSISGTPPQARSRAVARVANHELRTLSVIPMAFHFIDASTHLDVVALSGALGTNGQELALTISGAWSAAALAATESPYCRTISPLCPEALTGASMLDFVRSITGAAQPGVDLDLDGLESFHDDDGDGLIDRCVDGCIGACTTPTVVTSTVGQPCATDPRFADGYSITLEVTAVPATIVGIGR